MAQRLTHPKFGVEKTYDVTVVGHPTWEDVKVLLDGVRLAEGWAKVKKLDIRKRSKDRTQLRIVLDEGKNREIRRLLARIGHKVVKLKWRGYWPLGTWVAPAWRVSRTDRRRDQGTGKPSRENGPRIPR
ncbi:MAG: hypothetical protein R3B96_09875 [Pirellulaceae bacterium]